jgi:predicted ribosome-associated RNA-binding protein Tma20
MVENIKSVKIETLNKSSLKSAQEKSLRKQIIEHIPNIVEIIDKIWPKKSVLLVGKQKPYNIVYFVNDEPCFIQTKDAPIVPHLRLLHKCISYKKLI